MIFAKSAPCPVVTFNVCSFIGIFETILRAIYGSGKILGMKSGKRTILQGMLNLQSYCPV
jgi:hypothetical protein